MSKIKIGEHIKIIPGFPFNSALFNNDGEGLPLIRIRDLLTSKIETYYKGEYSKEYIIEEGDILIGMDGDFHIVKWKNKTKALLNQRIMKVAQKEGAKLNIEYFYYFLFPFLTDVWEKTTATTVKHLSTYDISEAELEFPEFEVQTKIARILSTADAVIEKTQAAIAKYKAIKQGMLHDLFTRGIDLSTNKLRPRYQDAPHLYKESKLGMIPREWDCEVLSSVIEVISGGTPSTHVKEYWNGEIPWLSVDDFNNGNRYALKAAKNITQLGLENSATNYLLPGMLIISARGTVGVISQMKFPMTFNQSCYGLNSINKALSNDFLYYFLLYFKQYIGFNAFGGVFDAITKKTFDEIFIPLNYSSNEHQLVVERLTAIDNKLQTEQTYLQKMQSLKKGLMEDLLSGKKKVKINEPQLYEQQ